MCLVGLERSVTGQELPGSCTHCSPPLLFQSVRSSSELLRNLHLDVGALGGGFEYEVRAPGPAGSAPSAVFPLLPAPSSLWAACLERTVLSQSCSGGMSGAWVRISRDRNSSIYSFVKQAPFTARVCKVGHWVLEAVSRNLM